MPPPRAARTFRTLSEARAGTSWAHTRTTTQPAERSSWSVSRSRRTFPASFAFHQDALCFGVDPWNGQECQKQPSTNTATRERRNTRSARRLDDGSARASIVYRNPCRCRQRRSSISAGVSRRFVTRMRWRTLPSSGSGRAPLWAFRPASRRTSVTLGSLPFGTLLRGTTSPCRPVKQQLLHPCTDVVEHRAEPLLRLIRQKRRVHDRVPHWLVLVRIL